MNFHSLEQKLQMAGSAVHMARNSQVGALVSDIPGVPAEFSNWRDEQAAWRTTAALLDLTHHMTDLSIEGPDTIRMLSDLGVNSFKGFAPGKAKQFICCNSEGKMIGDGILFHLEENRLVFVGRAPVANWIQFHSETGGYNVTVAVPVLAELA